jgi:hypothetical protein
MKKILRLTLIAILFCIGVNTNSFAQNSVRISGSTCAGSKLTATITGNSVEKVEWKLNGLVVSTMGSSRQGVTVAGGNGPGNRPDQLYYPNGVFIDKDDNIWVADASNGRVQKFTPGNPDAVTIGGNLPNHPTFPVNVFVCPDGAVYVADYFEGKVKRLAKDGTKWINVAGQHNELDLVRGVWVDKDGNVYCTQYGYYFNGTVNLDGMILKYPPHSSQWQIVAGGNGTGSALNQFSIPTSVMLDDGGNIYVADGLNDHGLDNARVMKWAPGATQGVIVAGGNGIGHALNQCAYPLHAFIDRNGDLYVSNSEPYNEIQKWPAGILHEHVVAGGNGTGDAADQLQGPFGIYKKGKYLYVCDASNFRIQRFDLTEPNSISQFAARHPGTYSAKVTFEDGNSIESNSIIVSNCNENLTAPGEEDATVTRDIKTAAITSYPNPATNTINVRYTAGKSGIYLFELVDMGGKILSHKAINVMQGANTTTFDASQFARGTYFINITEPGGKKQNLQISKQ